MRHRWIIRSFFIGLELALLAGCAKALPRSATGTTPATEKPKGEPVVALWDGGVHLAHTPPSLLFAAWADGTVIRGVNGKMQIGDVPPETIKNLLAQMEQAGFHHPSVSRIEKPDGPVKCLTVVSNGHSSQLYYDGTTDYTDLGPQAYPSRQQCEDFVRMWQDIEKFIAAVQPVEMREVTGPLGLAYPGK